MALSKQKRVQRINNEHFFRVHPELRGMISAFISALLKQKPDDVDLFAENFFTQPDLAHQLGYYGWTRPPTPEPLEGELEDSGYEGEEMFVDDEEEAGGGGGTTQFSVQQLEQTLISLFKEADQDNSGTLEFAEFAQLMATASIGLNSSELQLLLAEADENSDGLVTYQEFVPLAVEVIQTMRLKERIDAEEDELDEVFRDAAMNSIGVSSAEVESMVTKKVNDLGGDGMVTTTQGSHAALHLHTPHPISTHTRTHTMVTCARERMALRVRRALKVSVHRVGAGHTFSAQRSAQVSPARSVQAASEHGRRTHQLRCQRRHRRRHARPHIARHPGHRHRQGALYAELGRGGR